MNALKTVMTSLLMVALNMALAQVGNDRGAIKPIPRELLAKVEKAGAARNRGKALLKENRIEEAIEAFRESIEIEKSIPGFESSGSYELAKALTLAGRNEEALAAYKAAVQWHPDWQELYANGPPFPYVLLDYSILLAKCGKAEEARMVYYSVLRMYNPDESSDHEPYPFLVVFDPDPIMDVWEYSIERFVAAATMARAPYSQSAAKSMTEEVRRMEPNWIVPVMYQAHSSGSKKRAEFLSLAESLVKTDQERAWVRSYAGPHSKQRTGFSLRKTSAVLLQAKLALAKDYSKVASAPEPDQPAIRCMYLSRSIVNRFAIGTGFPPMNR